MSDKIIVQPRTVDGVEFYVSDRTKDKGMSVNGLARLCGVEPPAVFKLLEKLDDKSLTWDAPKCLKCFIGNVFNRELVGHTGGGQAKIVRSEVCSGVIEYYAFDSRARNDIAKHTYRRFATKGIDTWIDEITGSVHGKDNAALMGAMQEILGKLTQLTTEVSELKSVATKYENLRAATITNFPRLDEMLEGLESNDRILPQADDELTLTQWLATKGITFDSSTKMRFGNLVSNTFQCMTGDRPKKARCKDKNGNYTEKQNVYAPCHFPILEIALKQMF